MSKKFDITMRKRSISTCDSIDMFNHIHACHYFLHVEHKDYVSSGNEIVVPDMHTRKKMMFDSVEAFIALPGGIGTMEELMEVLTWANLELHSKPIALLNVNGYYNHFIQWVCV